MWDKVLETIFENVQMDDVIHLFLVQRLSRTMANMIKCVRKSSEMDSERAQETQFLEDLRHSESLQTPDVAYIRREKTVKNEIVNNSNPFLHKSFLQSPFLYILCRAAA